MLSTPDPAAVTDFYARVLGWTLQPADSFPGTDGREIAARGSGQRFIVRRGPVGWLPFLSVIDLPAVLERARAAGGRVVFPVPGDQTRRVAMLFDPSGARLGVYEPDHPAGAQATEDGPAPGSGPVVWLEEKSRNQEAAAAFHAEVFGFTPVGPSGPGKVKVLRPSSGAPYAGVMQFDDRWAGDHPPHWLVYTSVKSLSATIEDALAQGGSVWFQPTDTPLGRLAYLRDPAGNAFAVIEVAPATSGTLLAPDRQH